MFDVGAVPIVFPFGKKKTANLYTLFRILENIMYLILAICYSWWGNSQTEMFGFLTKVSNWTRMVGEFMKKTRSLLTDHCC